MYVSPSIFVLIDFQMATMMKNFPLLNEIDEQINLENIEWNKDAFQTLLVGFSSRIKSNEIVFPDLLDIESTDNNNSLLCH